MESMRNSGSNVDLRTGPSTNPGEGEQFNKEKKQVPSSSSPVSSEFTSQDHFDFIPNATTTTTNHPRPLGSNSPIHDQTHLQSELHNTHSVAEKRDGRHSNSHLEAHTTNPFCEVHPSPFTNNTSASSSSQNPFLMMSDATNTTHPLPSMQQQKVGMTSNSLSIYPSDEGLYSSLAPSTYESSEGIPFKAPTSANSKNTYGDEHHDHSNESHHRFPSPEQHHWSMASSEARTHQSNNNGETHTPSSSRQVDPFFTLESTQNQQEANASSKNRAGAATNVEPHHTFSVTEQGHHSKISSNSGTDNKLGSSVSSFAPASETSTQDRMHSSICASSKAPPKQGKEFKLASEFSDDDIPISSFPKHGQQGSDSAGQYSSVVFAPGTSNGSEKQNPPLQVMERSEDPTTSSVYKFPSHVFDRHKSKSNNQWSTASNESLFSIQMGNMSFSSEMAWMGKSGDMDKAGDTNSSTAFQSNQPLLPPQPQPPSTKFNDISQSTAKQHQGSRVTEEKAAETMREVIMESSIHKESISKGDLLTADGATGSDRRSDYNAHSHHSDASTKSFAFNVLTDGDKPLSSKQGEEKRKQQKHPDQQNLKATPDAAVQNPKPAPNAPQNKSWLSCFSCC